MSGDSHAGFLPTLVLSRPLAGRAGVFVFSVAFVLGAGIIRLLNTLGWCLDQARFAFAVEAGFLLSGGV